VNYILTELCLVPAQNYLARIVSVESWER